MVKIPELLLPLCCGLLRGFCGFFPVFFQDQLLIVRQFYDFGIGLLFFMREAIFPGFRWKFLIFSFLLGVAPEVSSYFSSLFHSDV